ncbi:hypothetical protein KBZ10_16140 [Streptomyces sp. F63]|uniref:hypothetical protein n=1 Tax=Streptomyces sp. F63 TaxID=2824887 RepID=UPI001B35B5B9|nr:hypothetical protein [Streptomyces sp. F63]MBQ0986022.1 hypothetical protein [Streptomyces sp. F63]
MKATIRRGGIAAAAGLGLCLALLPAGQTQARDRVYVPCGNIAALKAAITSANAGGGPVLLASGCTYTLTAPDTPANADDGLPEITGNVQIASLGGATLQRSSTDTFRILSVVPGGSLTLNRITVRGGEAAQGGGIHNAGRLALHRSTVRDNTGSGIHNSGVLGIYNSALRDNSASSGGGLANVAGSATVNSSRIHGNFATSGGGGIVNAATLRVRGSSLYANRAEQGGGLFNRAGTAVFFRSTVRGNTATAPAGGGGVYEAGGTVAALGSAITGNAPNNCTPLGGVPGCVG